MKSQSVPFTLPLVVDQASPPIEIGMAAWGFSVQFLHVTSSNGATFALEGSLDGETFVDVTKSMVDAGNGGAAVAGPIAADALCSFSWSFAGQVRIKCKAAPSSNPTTPPTAVIAFQDTTQL